MKRIIFSCGILLSFSLAAQITLTQSDFPVAGDVFTLHLSDTTGVQPGNAGTGINWNFVSSDSSVGTMVDSFKTVMNTPYSASYPQANLALHEISPTVNYFVYFNVNASSADRVGNADLINVITYTNPATQYIFPITYGTNSSDTYSASYVDANSGSTVHVHGSGTMNADATGTIVLPSGTYNNVLRVHYTRTEHDTIFTVANGNFPVTVTESFYLWYQAGEYYPIFHLQMVTNQVASGPVTHKKVVGWRAGNLSAGIMENTLSTVRVYPIPATDKIFIEATDHLIKTVSLFDLGGKAVQTANVQGANSEMRLDGLGAGTYFLVVTFSDGKTETQLIQHN
ncbi:MAG: T9SS type A sorting domain-containing protein [Bacteroidia bacterium]